MSGVHGRNQLCGDYLASEQLNISCILVQHLVIFIIRAQAPEWLTGNTSTARLAPEWLTGNTSTALLGARERYEHDR